MRIIAGQARGRRIHVPKGNNVRPTSDRVRESLFSILGTKTTGAVVLDMFAGSGALGLEALSRGASSAVFIEKSKAVQGVLKRNISELDFSGGVRVIGGDALAAVGRLAREGVRFDIIFLDPPYAGTLLCDALRSRQLYDIMSNKAFIVAEHQAVRPVQIPESLRTFATRSYGGTVLSFIEHAGSRAPVSKENENP